jgi:hypothetical protein
MEDTNLIFARWGRRDLDNLPRLTGKVRNAFARAAGITARNWIARPSRDRFAPPMHASRAS